MATPDLDEVAPELRRRNLRTILALAALFFVPLAASFWLYYGSDWRPGGRTNHGELIDPARPLPAATLPVITENVDPAARPRSDLFQGRWSLVYVAPGPCQDACRRALYVMRQTRLALNNDMTRVQRVWLVTGACCEHAFLAQQHPGLLLADASGPPAAPLLARFPAEARSTSVFVVDPLGNLMMRYDIQHNPRGLLDDLRKLLRLSHIG